MIESLKALFGEKLEIRFLLIVRGHVCKLDAEITVRFARGDRPTRNCISGVVVLRTMVTVSDERDRRIFSILAHGEKQRIEILRLLEKYEGISEDAADNRLKNAETYYDTLEKAERNDGVYYFRTDVGREMVQPKPFAEKKEVSKIFSDLETVLGINKRKEKHGATLPPDSRPTLLRDLLDMSMHRKYILYDDETKEQFLAIFNEYLQRMSESYQHPNNNGDFDPKDITDTQLEYREFLQLTRELLHNSKRGQEPYELGPDLLDSLDKIMQIFPDLPVQLGLDVQGLVNEIHEDQGKELFQQLLHLEKYDNEYLRRQAFYSYDIHNEVDDLLDEISELADKTTNESQANKLRRLVEDITNLYIHHPVSSQHSKVE
ncbi:hypothetical protein [Halorientalis salina]|uniref:hypothetical protein n=1 Tax=Halorientalis salina TaxID=2932266 RepID=UPI0010AB939A|nr:hypothetical protein [Halorientalis salina]